MEIDYVAHTNELRDMNSTVKCIIVLFLLVFALIVNSPIVSIILTLIIGAVLLLIAKVPYKFYFKFISIPFGFAFITCIFIALFFGSGPVFFDTGILWIVIREDILALAINTFFRTLACFYALGVLSSTTPIAEILYNLEKLKIPKIFIQLSLLMYTTIFVF